MITVTMESDIVQLTKRQQWSLFAAAASAVAAPIAERAVVAAWRLAAGEDPPEDPAGPDVDWGRAIVWTATAAVFVAVAQVVARRGAAIAWEHAIGERPPRQSMKRTRKRSRN
ncbi:MAG: DUF4235 domain-containing protein [Gemmatimonadaceae bacterium]